MNRVLPALLVLWGCACSSPTGPSSPDAQGGVEEDAGPSLPTDAGVRRLFWAESNQVFSLDLDGGQLQRVAMGNEPTSVAIDAPHHLLYWTDQGSDSLHRAQLDGGDAQRVYQGANSNVDPRGLSVDSAADRLFWCEDNLVLGALLDGGMVHTLAVGSFPSATAVDGQWVYYSDQGTDSVHRMLYDGGEGQQLYRSSDSFANPEGLSLDPVHGRLYWAENVGIRTMAVLGGDVGLVLDGGTLSSTAVDVFHHTLYWSERSNRSIYRAPLDGGGGTMLHQSPDVLARPRGLSVLP